MELPYVLQGTVERGKQLGSSIGFPTANIALSSVSEPLPPNGVYAGLAQVEGEERPYPCILNQGSHPTAPEGHPTVEAHLIGYPYAVLYGKTITLCYGHFLRPEQHFDTIDELKERIEQDRRAAILWLEPNESGLLRALEYGKELPL